MFTYDIGPVTLTIYGGGLVVTRFKGDGAECVFAPPRNAEGNILPQFIEDAKTVGWNNPEQFAVIHEIAHNVLALYMGLPHSRIVYRAAHKLHLSMEQEESAWEESTVNALMTYMLTEKKDPWGNLDAALGDKLDDAADRLSDYHIDFQLAQISE